MRLALLCSFILLLCTCVRAQCPTNLFIDSNQDVAEFRANWPVCTSLPGNLTISGAAVTDVSGLSILKGVGGDVLIEDLLVSGISGLENITGIAGDFTITNCRLLEGNGFPEGLGLRNLSGFLSLNDLPSLTQMIPLNDLNILSSGFGSNAVAISNFSSLSGLSGNMVTLVITANPNLTDLTALTGIGLIDELTITGNTSLNNCAIDPVCASLGAGNTASISGNGANCANVTRVTQQCFPSCTTPDYAALEAIYNATNGDNWTDNTNWLENCDYCTWFGVTCDANDRVERLELPNNNLVGTMPAELADLTEVKWLRFNNNTFSGGVPSLIPLDNLERLRLHRSGFSGAVPILGNKPNLTHLSLYDNAFSGPIPTSYNEQAFPALAFLYLDRNELTGTLKPSLAEFPDLEELHLHTNNLTGCYPASFSAVCNIQSYQFYGNPDLPDGGSSAFFEDEFCANGTQCAPCSHPDYPSLMAFYEDMNQLNNNPTFTGWAEGAAGTNCDPCTWYGVTCDANDRVTELQFLQVGLTGSLAPEISQLSELTSLVLTGNNISGSFPSALWNTPKLEVMGLNNNNLSGPLPDAGSLPTMKQVFLQNNNLSGALPIFGNCPDLEAIVLNNNPFGDIIGDRGYDPVHLPSLTYLDLANTNLVGFLPEELGQWPAGQLGTLFLQNNSLQGCYPPSFMNLCGENVNFSNNGDLLSEGSLMSFNDSFCDFGVGCPLDCHPDYVALANLYVSTNGDDWTDNTNWLTDCDVCDWFGIICDADDRVWQIRLNNNNLTGTLPTQIGDFPELITLILSFNEIGGALPAELGNLDKATDIQLSVNQFTGTIPASLFISTALDRISLSANNLSGAFPDLTGVPGLRQLYIGSNNLSGALPAFPSLSELFEISLAGNDINGPFPESLNATQLPALQLINMGFCGLTGALPPNVSDWTDLDEFYLNGNEFSGCYPADYDHLCDPDIAYSFTNNSGLPDGGSDDFFENTFCATGQTCEEDCPTDLIISTNQDITDFRAQYPNCSVLAGDLIINGANITNTSQLSVITAVGGDLQLRNLTTTSAPGLTSILTVGNDFIVQDCPNLGVNGFGNNLDLQSVGRDLTLQDLPSLTEITPLSSLTTVGGFLTLRRTGTPSLSGLGNLAGVVGGLVLQDNDNLTDLSVLASPAARGVATLTSVGSVTVLDNDSLTDLTGFSGWTVPGSFTIRDNDLLSDCAADAVCQKIVQDDNLLFISDNNAGCNGVVAVEASCSPALPVTWQSFTATATAKDVNLAWATTEEVNNNFFMIERSADGASWSEIGRVGAGETYTYKDAAPLNGDNYYRLRQVDHDGAFTFSVVQWVSFSNAFANAWPNPFNGTLNLYSPEPDLILVYDINGRELQQIEHLGGGAQVQRLGLKQGVYLLRFQRSGEVLRVIAK